MLNIGAKLLAVFLSWSAHYTILNSTFILCIFKLQARGANIRGLPRWLRWDEPASALYGVPSRKDVGRHVITIKAIGSRGDVAKDSFYIHVVPPKNDHYTYKDGKVSIV